MRLKEIWNIDQDQTRKNTFMKEALTVASYSGVKYFYENWNIYKGNPLILIKLSWRKFWRNDSFVLSLCP